MMSCKFNTAYIKNSTISVNSGDFTHAMFYIKLFKPMCAKYIHFKGRVTKRYSNLYFQNTKQQ